jgi:hypothetical protein
MTKLTARRSLGVTLLAFLITAGSISESAAAGPLTPDQDFAARCAAPGVMKCMGMDTVASTIPNNGGNGAGSEHDRGYNFGLLSIGDGVNPPAIDTTVKASGAGSMRMTISKGGNASSAGQFFANFGNVNGTGNLINTGDQIYIQYRVRWDAAMANPANFPDAGGGITAGHKISDVSFGDLASCSPTNKSSADCPTSCPNQGFEMVTQQFQDRPTYMGYANCSGVASFQPFTHVVGGTNFSIANVTGCFNPYNQGPGCFVIQPNEWFTVKLYFRIGQYNTWSNAVKVWFGHEGQPLVKYIDCSAEQPIKCDGNGVDPATNGWIFNMIDPNTGNPTILPGFGVGKVWLGPFTTNLGSALATGNVWYDELIISTQDIADPGGAADTLRPQAPTNMQLL